MRRKSSICHSIFSREKKCRYRTYPPITSRSISFRYVTPGLPRTWLVKTESIVVKGRNMRRIRNARSNILMWERVMGKKSGKEEFCCESYKISYYTQAFLLLNFLSFMSNIDPTKLENLRNIIRKPHVNSQCIGCGVCESLAPDVFHINYDDGLSYVQPLADYTWQESEVQDAISACPVSAISFQDASADGVYLDGLKEHEDAVS